MKKVLLSAAIVAISFGAFAQKGEGFAKGDFMVSGAFNYNSSTVSSSAPGGGSTSTSGYSFSPSIGYFVTEKIALVGGITYSSPAESISVAGVTTPASTSSSSFTLNAAGRYYMTPGSKFSIFGQAGIQFGSNSYSSSGTSVSVSKFGFQAVPGISYFLTNHFAMEAQLPGLTYTSYSTDGGSASTMNFGVGLSGLGFGLVYKF